MNILLFDPYLGKFTPDMIEWWQNKGHEVKAERYYNPSLVDWADVIWFETSDNNILSATNPSQALIDDEANFKPWDLHEFDLSKKKVICRMIDIEVWQQHYMAPEWDLVDDIIFIAPHIRELVDLGTLPMLQPKTKFHTIPCGVNLDRYKFKERKPGFDIAIVSEKWTSKGTHLLLQVILKLSRMDSRYKFHWLGQRSDSNWEYAYFDDFVEHHKLPIEFTNILTEGTVDDFLEGKNYLLHGSVKEGHSYAINEAAVKGIRVVAHRFFGADHIWGGSGFLWDTIDEAVDMIVNDQVNYNSRAYLDFCIKKGYTSDMMMRQIDRVING